MTRNNTETLLQSLLPTDRKFLLDDEQKVGQIKFTTAEKRELLKLVTSKGWEVLKGVYVKQRLVQIAVAGINVSQNEGDLFFYKGKAAEVDYMVKHIEDIAKSLQKEEESKNKPVSS